MTIGCQSLSHFRMRGEKRTSREESSSASRKMQRRQQHKKKHRRQQQQSQQSGPSAAFLAALEDQRERERERQRQAEKAPTAATAPAPVGAPRPLTGFYFDEAQRRYFRLTPQVAQRQQRAKAQQQQAKEREAAAQLARRAQLSSSVNGPRRSSALRTATSKSWLAYVAERESSAAWSAGRRDRREMAQRMFASRTVRSHCFCSVVDVSTSRSLALLGNEWPAVF